MKYSNEQKQMFQQIADYIGAMPIGTVTTTARGVYRTPWRL